MDLLRFTTAGSVDDGKSTLIGRLLHDTKSIFQDQMERIEGASRRLGEAEANLALLTDGLRAEREQKITIDVAYRYFATPKRKFIISDTPGHVQYTRNMVTGASSADLAVILIDARKGVLTQSRRHAFITSLLGIPNFIVAVNKMDLVDYSESVYDGIVEEFRDFAGKLTVNNVSFVPLSALRGDNVVDASERMPWYGGAPLLHELETIQVGVRRNAIDFRFPVQYVIRPDQSFRGYAGTVASGSVRPGEEILVLPSGTSTRVRTVETSAGQLEEAVVGDAVVVTTEGELDISRGDMIVRRKNVPAVTNVFDAYLCWMNEKALEPERPYVLLHTTREARAWVDRVEYRVDVDTLHREAATTLGLNEIGRVRITTSQPIFFDSYRVNSATGSFVLVDPHTDVTVAAGMIRGQAKDVDTMAGEVEASASREADGNGRRSGARPVSPNVVRVEPNIPRLEREARNGHEAAVVWFTGMSGAGKTTIARAVERRLFERGCQTVLLDGDHLRHGLCGDLGFSTEDRSENIRRAGEVARLFFEQGSLVLCAFVSPRRSHRDAVRALIPDGRFLEVHVHAPTEVLRERDPKGLYRSQEAGRISGLPGVDSPYEVPRDADVSVSTDAPLSDATVEPVIEALRRLAPGALARRRRSP